MMANVGKDGKDDGKDGKDDGKCWEKAKLCRGG